MAKDKRHPALMLSLLLILGIAVVFRLYLIDRLPPGFHFDESFEGLEAWRILTDPGYRPIFLTGNFGVPPLNAYANALAFGIWELVGGEAGPTAMRVTAAVFGLLGVLAVYALGDEQRRLQPELTMAFPLLAAAVLAIMRWHIHFSRMGIEPVMVPLEWAAANWLLLRGWRTGGWLNFVGLGVVLAACFYTYQGAWVIPFLVLILAVHLLVAARSPSSLLIEAADGTGRSAHDRSRRRRWGGLLLAAALAALLVAPLVLSFLRNPELLLLRPGQIAITGSDASPAGFWQNLWATVRMYWPFGSTGDMDPRRNLPGAPALSLWLAVPFWIGLGMALWRIRRPAYSLLLIGLAGLLLPGVVSEYAPHFHRVLGAAAPTALLVALPLAGLWDKASTWRKPDPVHSSATPPDPSELPVQDHDRPLSSGSDHGTTVAHSHGTPATGPRSLIGSLAIPLAIVVLLAIAAISSAHTYFVRWAALPDLYYAFDAGLWDLGRWIAAQPDETPIYLTPRSAEHPTLAFAWREGTDGRGPPVSFDGRHIFPLTAQVSSRSEQYAVVEAEDFRTRLLLPEVFPEAEIVHELADAAGQPYARVYARPGGSVPQRLPEHTLDVPMGDGIRLLGYDVIPGTPQAGGILFLRLHWQVDSRPAGDWTVFTHLVDLDASGSRALLAGRDAPPGAGSLPTTRWQPGWRIIDEYQLELPLDLPAGSYGLEAGLYQPTGQQLPPAGSIPLGNIQVEQAS